MFCTQLRSNVYNFGFKNRSMLVIVKYWTLQVLGSERRFFNVFVVSRSLRLACDPFTLFITLCHSDARGPSKLDHFDLVPKQSRAPLLTRAGETVERYTSGHIGTHPGHTSGHMGQKRGTHRTHPGQIRDTPKSGCGHTWTHAKTTPGYTSQMRIRRPRGFCFM